MLIKGQVLAKLLSDSNCKVLELHQTFTQSDAPVTQLGKDSVQVFENYSSSPFTLVQRCYLLSTTSRIPTRFEKDEGQVSQIKICKFLQFKSELL
jgi:hypothetical protein